MEQRIIVPVRKLIIPRSLKGKVISGGIWGVEHWRGGRLIGEDFTPNIVPNQHLNHILSVIYNGVAQVSPWYVAIFEGNYTPAPGVTAASFTADATESTAYTEATRVEYVEAAAAAQSITNAASKAVFTMNATKTIYGAALISASAKSATTGTIGPVTRFTTSRAVINLDVLNITYTMTQASA